MGDIRKTTNSDTPTRLQPFTPLERGSIETDQQPKKDKLEETVKEVFKAQTTIREKTDLNEGKSVWKHIKSLFSSLLRRTYLIAHQKFSFAMASSRDDVKITYGIVRQEMLIDHITQLIGRIEVNTIKDVERLIWLDKQLDKCQANLELQREFYQKKSNLSSSQLKLIYTFDLFNEKIRLARDAFAEKVNLSTSNIRELILTKNQAIKPVTLVEISELLIRLGANELDDDPFFFDDSDRLNVDDHEELPVDEGEQYVRYLIKFLGEENFKKLLEDTSDSVLTKEGFLHYLSSTFKSPAANDPSESLTIPAKMPNPGINACYRNSSFQQIVNSPMLEAFSIPLVRVTGESKSDFVKRKNIQSAFLNLADKAKNGTKSQIRSAERRLRTAVLKSRFNADLNIRHPTRQQDATIYIGVLMEVIKQPLKTVTTRKDPRAEVVGETRLPDSNSAQETEETLQIGIPGRGANLQEMLDHEFEERLEDNPWETLPNHLTSKKIVSEPRDFQIISVKRFDSPLSNEYNYDTPVSMPKDNKLDFSMAYGRQKGSLEYQMTGFIRHSGSSDGSGGHYVSYVKKGDVWFYCSDSTIYEVSQEVVDREKELAYVAFFKKVKDV